MAYPEPPKLDDIYGPGAENADDEIDDEIEECAICGYPWPLIDLEDDICPDCREEDQE